MQSFKCMSYQLGYDPPNIIHNNFISFKCMSYQLGYELRKILPPFSIGFKCMSYQLGYDLVTSARTLLFGFKCMSYQISKKSYSKDSFFIFLKLNNKCLNIKRGRTLIKSYTISFAPNLRHFINN